MRPYKIHDSTVSIDPAIFAGLSKRQIIYCFAALSLGVLSGVYIYFILGLDINTFSPICYIVSAPFWALAFWNPQGMKLECFVPYWLRSQQEDVVIRHAPANSMYFINPAYEDFTHHNGVEMWCPSHIGDTNG